MKDPYQRKSAHLHVEFLVLLQRVISLLNSILLRGVPACSSQNREQEARSWQSKARGLSARCRRLTLLCQVRPALLCYPHKGARIAKHHDKASPSRESSRDFPTAVAEFINKFTQL